MLSRQDKQTGFSLLEIALTLILVSLLLYTALSHLNHHHQRQKYKATEQQLTDLKQTILNYIQVNHYLPCPDNDNDGYENRKLDGSCQTNRGRLPYLEFGGIGRQDAFGQPFLYAAHSQTTQNSLMRDSCLSASLFAKFGSFSQALFERDEQKTRHCTLEQCRKDKDGDVTIICNTLSPIIRSHVPYFSHLTQPLGTTTGLNGALRVCSHNATSCVSNTGLTKLSGNHLPLVIVSFGLNGAQTWQNCTSVAVREQENCDNDIYFQQGNLEAKFDDQLIWITMHEVKALVRADIHWTD